MYIFTKNCTISLSYVLFHKNLSISMGNLIFRVSLIVIRKIVSCTLHRRRYDIRLEKDTMYAQLRCERNMHDTRTLHADFDNFYVPTTLSLSSTFNCVEKTGSALNKV